MIEYDRYLAIPDLLDRAIAFTADAHQRVDQKRKYTDEPYENHPFAVMEIVRSVPHTVEMLCAAALHDTVEDTDVTIVDILYLFGLVVTKHVDDLTDVSRPSDGNYATRKAIDRAHTARALPASKTIKAADCLHNGYDIVANDRHFAVAFLRQIRSLADGPLIGADPTLLAQVNTMIENNLDDLERTTNADREERRARHEAQCEADKARKRAKGLAHTH